ncbi:MAG: hypothetical protein CHACPFDD_00378 [Phycisphaerae bacterium]|nr:hypothetical protein [Phycisphaerae bacterium]
MTRAARSRPAHRRRRSLALGALALWAALMLPLLRWGLPDRTRDELLFAGGSTWPAERYQTAQALEQRGSRAGGADTDLNPLAAPDQLIDLTSDEAGRAEILRRFRLFSRQPDEMITFMALQRMSPRQFDFDPKLYQYGGAYIYVVGALLAAGKACGLLTVTSDAGVYLTQPELFGRFYLAARGLSLAAGALTLVGVARLAARVGGRRGGWVAALLAACSPVFVTACLEAKPHLISTAALVWAALAALRFDASPARRTAIVLGALCGAAFGLVLTGLCAIALLPCLALRVPRAADSRFRSLALAVGCAAAVYAVTNPYVILHLLTGHASFSSNLANSTAMYTVGRFAEGASRVARLLVESVGLGTLLLGLCGSLAIVARWPRRTLLVAAPAVFMLLVATAIGAGKPAEFARFLLLPSLLAAGAAGAWLARLAVPYRRTAAILFLAALAVSRTWSYVHAFATDALGIDESRRVAALALRGALVDNEPLALTQVPAPYATPPIDFDRRQVLLLPRQPGPELPVARLPRLLVCTADNEQSTASAWWRRHYELRRAIPPHGRATSPISWANKPVFIFERR